MGLIHTVRSIRVLTKRALALLEVVSCSPEVPSKYPQHRAGLCSGEAHLQGS